MFSDADPVVALDPKQQQRELTKPSIYTGIPVAVSCLKNKQYPMHRPHLPGKHTTASVFCVWQKKNSIKRYFSGHESSNSLFCCISGMVAPLMLKFAFKFERKETPDE